MSSPVLPIIVQGPAIVIFDGYSYYTKDPIKVGVKRTTFDIESDMFGKVGRRLKSQIGEISFTPVGEIESAGKYLRYTALHVGTSIFGLPADPKSLVIHSKTEGKTYTWKRAGQSKHPTLFLSPTKTLWGPMGFNTIGLPLVQPTDAASWKAIASAAFADTGFDETKIITDIYSAAYGDREAPFDAMGAIEGFEVDLGFETQEMMDDGTGIGDIVVKSVGATCKFAPNNLSEDEADALLAIQDETALLVGQEVGVSNEDLVITSDALELTLPKCGVESIDLEYGTGRHRHQGLMFSNRESFTAGAPTGRWSLTIN